MCKIWVCGQAVPGQLFFANIHGIWRICLIYNTADQIDFYIHIGIAMEPP